MAASVLCVGLFAGPTSALAVNTWHLDLERMSTSTPYNLDDPATGDYHVMAFDSSGYPAWLNPDRFQDEFLNHYYSYIDHSFFDPVYDGFNNSINTLNANVATLQSTVGSLGGGTFNVTAFMSNQASTTPFIASSTSNGFMSSAMAVKVNALSTSTVSTTTNGLMSSADKSKLDGLSVTATQGGSCTTDTNGNCTVTFATSFSTTPKVSVTAIQATAGTLTNVQISSKSATSVTVHVNTLATVLGLLTLTTSPSGVVVDVVATTQ